MPRKERNLRIRVACCCLLLLCPVTGLAAEEDQADAQDLIATAARLEAEGNTDEAAGIYRQWLERNPDSARLFNVLVQALRLEKNAGSALNLLETYTPAVENPQDRNTLLYNRALLLEMLGRIEDALVVYGELPAYGQVLYKRALLFFELGNLQEAEEQLRVIDADLADKEIRARALNLQARLYLATDREDRAERTFETLRRDFMDVSGAPVFLLSYFDYLLAADRRPEAEALLESLRERFPASPEYRLALSGWQSGRPGTPGAEVSGEGEVRYTPAPWRLLAPLEAGSGWTGTGGAERPAAVSETAPPTVTPRGQQAAPETAPAPASARPPEVPGTPEATETTELSESPEAEQPPPAVLIQVGSFGVAENAHYLKQDLAAQGFTAHIAEVSLAGKVYYRVLIGPERSPEEAQQLLLRLKDAGFEGVMLWSED